MAPTKERPATKTIATNREARHEYCVLEALETGVELKGTEVKSLRAGGVNLKDSWVDIEDGELLVKGMHITPYAHGSRGYLFPPNLTRCVVVIIRHTHISKIVMVA